MKNSILKIIGASLLTVGVFSFSSIALLSKNPIEKTEAAYTPGTTYTFGDGDTYYNGISSSLTGNSLLTALQSLNNTKRQTKVGYSSMGTSASNSAYIYTDYASVTGHDTNGAPYGNTISSFYTYTSATSWNREHVWPNSHGGGSNGSLSSPYIDADIHMPRPTISSENSSRGNSYFVEGKNHSSNGWDPYTAGYSENSRGEAARIMLYCVVADSRLSFDDEISSSTPNAKCGQISTILKWNLQYAVTNREKNRNEGAEYLQGNRNPFIDHPEYACKIWGNFNSTTAQICGASYGSVSISKSSQTLAIDETTTLSATSSNSSTITWTSSNTNVATVSPSSSASGANVTVTAKAVGTATITAKATIDGNLYSNTCAITVSASGGGSSESTVVTSNSSLSNGDKVVIRTANGDMGVTGYNDNKDATVSATESEWKQFVVGSASSSGFTLYDSAASKYIASPGGNEFKYGDSGGTCSVDSEGRLMCNSRYLCVNGTNYRFYTSIGSYAPFYVFKVDESSSKKLSSISLNTDNVTKTFTAGDSFSSTGLVVTAHYNDSTTANVTSSCTLSGYNMNNTGNQTVTVSYTEGGVTKTATYTITVNAAPTPTSISATVSKTYYVGETITKSDITVKDDLNNTITDFAFANNNYQFVYSDSSSGGVSKSKTFTNAITSGTFTCSLTVQVQRKARTNTSTSNYSISYTDLPTSYQTSTTERTAASGGIKFIAYNCANYSSKMQFKASGGYLQTTQALSLTTLTINNRETNALTVYGSNTAGSFSTTITGTNDVYNLSGYAYLKIMKNGSGAAYCSDVVISVGSSDTAANLANYIMYEDTNNQCTSKFTTAKGYFEGLSSSERSTFMTSSDYVVSTARTRLQAWAAHLGKTITQSNGDYVISNTNSIGLQATSKNTNALITVIVVITMTCAGALGSYLLLKRKRKR